MFFIKKLFLICVIIILLSSCRSINYDKILTRTTFTPDVVYNSNITIKNAEFSTEISESHIKSIVNSGINTTHNKLNNKKNKRKFIINYNNIVNINEDNDYQDPISSILSLIGLTTNNVVSNIYLTVTIKTSSGILLKEYSSQAKQKEFISLIYGYKKQDAIEAASLKAFKKAYDDILRQINFGGNLDLHEAEVIKNHKEKIKKEEERISMMETKRIMEENNRRRNLIEKFGYDEYELISKNQIALGMSEEALIESWGKPRDINESVGPWGVHRQYVYSSSVYVYVENGKITSWQK